MDAILIDGIGGYRLGLVKLVTWMGAMLGEGMVKLGQVVLAEGMRAKLGDIRKCNLLLVFEKMSLRTKTRHLQKLSW